MKRSFTTNNQSVKYIQPAVVLLVLIFCEAFFFRNVIGTGALIGDDGDGRLTALLTEHWWRFFCGKEKFSELSMFYPCREVIGYTDLLLGYGIIHSVFRLAGNSIYASYKYTLIIVHAFGTASMYYLLNQKLKCRKIWALFGTIAFCFSCTYSNVLNHTQLNAVSFLPLLLILIIGYSNNIQKRTMRNIYAYCAITWFALISYNSWYVACFTGLFCLLLIVVCSIQILVHRVGITSLFKNYFYHIRKDLVGYLLYLVILFVPFLKIYMPVAARGQYSYWATTFFMPEIVDLINVTEDNFMIGWLIKNLGLSERNYSGEVAEGFSVVVICVFVALYYVWEKNNYKIICAEKKNPISLNAILINGTFITIIISILLVVKLSVNGLSLWWFIYTFIPVVRSMRAVARFWFWLSFPVSVLVAYVANKQTKANGIHQIATGLLIVMLFISNINVSGVYSCWSIKNETRALNNVCPPPSDVVCFYVINAPVNENISAYYQIDAYDIATKYSIKTINGYSGQVPMGWDCIGDIFSENYEKDVCRWIEDNKLVGVYAYDLTNNEWIRFEERIRK